MSFASKAPEILTLVGKVIVDAPASVLIVIAIPVTIVLLKSNQEQITTASFSPISFSSPPTMDITITPVPVIRGQTVRKK